MCAYLEPGGKNVQRVLYIFRCIFPAPDAGKTLDQGFKRTPVYRKPFTYKVDSTGITTIQNAQTGHLKWAQVEKVIDSQLCLYVYINKADAYVWPKAAVGKNYPKLMELLKKHVDARKLKIRLK